MADMFPPEKRSEIMSRIRSKETIAEKIVFKELRARRIYFQKHYKKAPGNPDIALPRKKKAVFIDGDFWHGRDYSRLTSTRPKEDYWVVKIGTNIERDSKNEKLLIESGWSTLHIWESDVKRKRTRDNCIEEVIKFLTSSSQV